MLRGRKSAEGQSREHSGREGSVLAPKTCSNVLMKTKRTRAGISTIVFFYPEDDPTAGRSLLNRQIFQHSFAAERNIYIYIYIIIIKK